MIMNKYFSQLIVPNIFKFYLKTSFQKYFLNIDQFSYFNIA